MLSIGCKWRAHVRTATPQRAVCDDLHAALRPFPVSGAVHTFRGVAPVPREITIEVLPAMETDLEVTRERLAMEEVKLRLVELRIVDGGNAPRKSVVHREGDLLEEIRICVDRIGDEILGAVDEYACKLRVRR